MSTIRSAIDHVRDKIRNDATLGQFYGFNNITRKFPENIDKVKYPLITLTYTSGGTNRFANIDNIILYVAIYSQSDQQIEDHVELLRNLFSDVYKAADSTVTIFGMWDRKGPAVPEYDTQLNAWEGVVEYNMRFGGPIS